tara:strand:- start:204 stop:467 length:264 start_codon:yes stop_codon:yes gene_type:complete
MVYLYYVGFGMKRDGWISEVEGGWVLRFRYDWESWDQNPKVWIEKGILQSNGIPLLKNRKKVRRVLAIKLWRQLLATGWRTVDPQWD